MDKSRNRQAYNEFFLQELERLNAMQRIAADEFEGPMLVIAGPGTGKTHVLGARIGRILMETDTFPENILCLTFTDAGVTAMRERLQQFIGPAAHRIHLFTFHGFCNSVIRDQPEYFGNYDLEPLSELDRIELIRALIDELPPDHPLYRSRINAYFYEEHLSQLFQRMNMEGWTPEYIEQQAQAWLEELPENPDYRYKVNKAPFRKGDLKVARIEEAEGRMRRLIAAAKCYPRYTELKRKASRYDYEDMLLWVVRAFEEHPFLLRNYQERYLYILVDEYQDTNGVQNDLLLKLISYWEQPNVFIVGDDDQSIYEFQGARLKNLLDFYRRYDPDLQVLVLQENYRSTQPILDWAGSLVRRNRIRIAGQLSGIDTEKRLVASNPQRAREAQAPVLREYPNRLQEMAHIGQQLEALLAQGVPPSEIAVLYARHQQAQMLSLFLAKKGIPFSAKRNIDVLQTPVVRQIIQILDYLLHESRQPHSGQQLLYKILHFRFWKIQAHDLARISFALQRKPEDDLLPWRSALLDAALLNPLEELPSESAIRQAAAILEGLIAAEANLPLPALVEQVINQSGLLQAACHQEQDAAAAIEILFSFLNLVREETQRAPALDIAGFFQILDRMRANRLTLPLVQQSNTVQGVQLVTAHSAKGLEFRYVFMHDVVKDSWEPSSQNRTKFPLPDTLTWAAEEDALEARRRLFYVAMTRAKEGLYISYARQDDKGKDLSRATFLDELLEDHPGSLNYASVTLETAQQTQLILLQDSAPPVLPHLEKDLVEERLRYFRLSISALNSYLNCPLGFYFEHIVQVPYLPSEAAQYGQAMHVAMQRLFDSMRRSKPRNFPPVKTFIQYFTQELTRRKGLLRPTSFQAYLQQGAQYLGAYYQQHLGAWHKDVNVEYTVRQVELDGIPLVGTIDKIEYHQKLRVGVVDYKTGRQNPERLRRPSEKLPQGGAYWRQLVFYKLLFEALDRSSRSVAFGEIAYLEPDPGGQFPTDRVDFEPEDAQFMRQLIAETYAKIVAHDFYTGCGQEDCPWCALVREEVLPPTLADPAIESLDDPS